MGLWMSIHYIFMRFSPLWSRSVSLCVLPLRSWAVVAPRHFHFTITALTVDRGRSSRAELFTNWLIRKMASYNGATLKVTELFSKAILLPVFVYGDCMAVCLILYACQQRVWLKLAKSTNSKGCPQTFAYSVCWICISTPEIIMMFWMKECEDI